MIEKYISSLKRQKDMGLTLEFQSGFENITYPFPKKSLKTLFENHPNIQLNCRPPL